MDEQDPGWLPDPFDPQRQRYWDGERWSEEARDAAPLPLAAAAPVEVAKSSKRGRGRFLLLLVLLMAVAGSAAVLFLRGSDDESVGVGLTTSVAPETTTTTPTTTSTTSTTTSTTSTTTSTTSTTTSTTTTIPAVIDPPQCNAVPEPLPEPTFSDIFALGEEATVSLAWAEAVGLVGGSGGAFAPDDPMSRGGAATVLWRYFCEPRADGAVPFADVLPDSFFADAVAWAAQNDILGGTSPTTFAPDDPITRAQFVTVTWRSVGSPDPSGAAPFTDTDPGAFYAAALDWAYSAGLVNGVTADMFAPGDPVSRLTAVVIFHRLETLVDPEV